jgi:hypothetical protein
MKMGSVEEDAWSSGIAEAPAPSKDLPLPAPAILTYQDHMFSIGRSKRKADPLERHAGHRRRDCWWEPIYDPDLILDVEPYDWDLNRDVGPFHRFIPASALVARLRPGETFDIHDAMFRECDFQGIFAGDPLIMFHRCRFVGCDFAYSTWRRCHFKDCDFESCSISLAHFDACDFRGCKWTNIGVTSRTELLRTFISNPAQLVAATVSGKDPRRPSFEHAMYQWHRLRGTRAHFLRSVLLSHATTGDEHTYYETVKLHEL